MIVASKVACMRYLLRSLFVYFTLLVILHISHPPAAPKNLAIWPLSVPMVPNRGGVLTP